MNDTLNEFSSEVDGQRYLKPELATQENDAFIQNLRGVQAQQNLENRQTLDNLGSYPASQSNLGGLGGSEATWLDKYQTAPTNNLMANLRATAEAQALTQAMQNEVNYLQNQYKRLYQAKARAAKAGKTTTTDDDGTSTWDGEFGEEETDGDGKTYTGVGALTVDSEDIARGGTYLMGADGNISRIDRSKKPGEPGYEIKYYRQADGTYRAKNEQQPLRINNGLQNNAPLQQPSLSLGGR